jgi:hypothetical protein
VRGFDCPGEEQHLHANDDEQLFQQIRRHTNQDHPGEYTDDKIRSMVKADGYEDVQHAEAQISR